MSELNFGGGVRAPGPPGNDQGDVTSGQGTADDGRNDGFNTPTGIHVMLEGFLTGDSGANQDVIITGNTAAGPVTRRVPYDEVETAGQTEEFVISEPRTFEVRTESGNVVREVTIEPGDPEQVLLDTNVPDYAVERGDAPPGFQGDSDGAESSTGDGLAPSFGSGDGSPGETGGLPSEATLSLPSGGPSGGGLAILAAAVGLILVILNGD
jgi:hypothetical protein